MNINLKPVPLDNPEAVTAVQLLDETGQLLVAKRGEVSNVAGGLVARLPVVGRFTWEAGTLKSGDLLLVHTRPGSAQCWVMSRKAGAPAGTRLHGDALAVYLAPHFVKGAKSSSPVTAVHHKDGSARVVFFANSQRTDPNPRSIGAAEGEIADARLIAQEPAGYVLLTLLREPGEPITRDTASGPRMAGLLHAQHFNQDLEPAGPRIPILGKQGVYEFDVASASKGEIAILATTPAGAIYARAEIKDTPLPETSWKETKFEKPLSSPSLVIRDGAAHCAFVESMGTPGAQVLRGQVD